MTSSEPVPRERLLSSIQTLRAFAAWIVVFHHYTATFPVTDPGWWRRAVHGHGAMGVDIFFVISGLVMGLSVSDPAITPRVFIARRLGRIVPAYWLTTLVVALLILEVPEMMPGWDASPAFLVKSLLFVPAMQPSGSGFYPVNTVGWTLNFEMAFYLIVAVSLFAARSRSGLWIATGIIVLHQLLSPLGIVSEFYTNSVLYEFLLGIIAAQLWRSGALRGPAWVFGCLGLIAIACFVHSPAYSGSRTLEWGLPALLLVCACLGLERYFARCTLLVRLGNHSYSVYLVHPIVWCTAHYLRQTMHPNGYVLVWGSLAAIALLGAASYRFLERPAGRLVTSWLLRLGQAARTDNASPEGRAA